MLTEVKAYSSWHSAPTLLLDENGRAETDLIQILDIQGLDPVKASISTTPFGSVDGASYVGGSVLSRNIVLTLRPNPDWDNWYYESLRRVIYSYFMPKRATRLVFYSNDIPPVEIIGIVEGVTANQFSKDPEFQVSIVCPDPYFTALEPTVLTGQTGRSGQPVRTINYNGNVETGIVVKVTSGDGVDPVDIGIQIGDPVLSYFSVYASVDVNNYFEMSSIPMRKYAQSINLGSGVITNLLSNVHVQQGSLWPSLQPGENEFAVNTAQGLQDWELTYFERFGGL